ncbi:hypothetical protein Pelo_15658 [Pelomyxa schiedti]|nr:hypothetical protein Pelo_15658 [Pelomyxa schiedti]
MQPQPQGPFAVRCVLAPPTHIARARDQISALLACVTVPRCGARSPASAVPHPIIADEIGRQWVMRVDRRIVIHGGNLASFPSPHPAAQNRLLFIGVSHTLGVVELWGRGTLLPAPDLGWVGNGCAAFSRLWGKRSVVVTADFRRMSLVEEDVGADVSNFKVCKARKWVVLFTVHQHKHVVIRPSSSPPAQPLSDENGRRIGGWKVVDVGRFLAGPVDMVDDDTAALLTVRGGAGKDREILCIDLQNTYDTGVLAVTETHWESVGLRSVVFHSKQHKVIVSLYKRSKNQMLQQIGSMFPLWRRPPPWRLLSVRPLKMLHCYDHPVHKIDGTHFSVEDTHQHTLSVFSTDEFDCPVRVFPLLTGMHCGNGFVVIQDAVGMHIDLIDAVAVASTPFPSCSHFLFCWLSVTENDTTFPPHLMKTKAHIARRCRCHCHKQPVNTPFAVRGALPAPQHALWARDQLAALLACLAVPRCGARSPASLVPHHVLACDVGQRFVTHVGRVLVMGAEHMIPGCVYVTSSGHVYSRMQIVVVGISPTLGVVDLCGWRHNADDVRLPYMWIGGGCAVHTNKHVAELVDLAEVRVVEEEVIGGDDVWRFPRVHRSRNWVVMYPAVHGGRIAVWPVLELQPPALSGWVHSKVVVTVEGQTQWLDIIDDQVVLVTRTPSGNFQVLCVDLAKTYGSGQLVVADSFNGSKGFEEMVFTSKQHKLIVAMCGRNKSKKSKDGGGYLLELRSLRPLKVLHTCPDKCVLHKVDCTHFAEADRPNKTLSVFSTDDFETPVRVFPLNGHFQCGNGFIVFTQQEEGYFDIVDAVTGTWLLRQPFLPNNPDSNFLLLPSTKSLVLAAADEY